MAGSFESFAGPSYISSRSADVILSDVRPIKLKLEALRCMNVLLDEFLYKILSAASSLSTDKLKAGLNKILPTVLGKEAVLEAELELKAYWERNTPHRPSAQDFDLQWSFELLRLKCEAYSTMNDNDEDVEVESRLNERMQTTGASGPPHNSLMAPAALYMTAILEHVCQHVLSNVSRVAARDSSRTLATVNDLFVALCEDECIYCMFKTMKVYEQIESLSKAQKPRRTRSMSTNGSMDFSRAGSPMSDTSTPRESVSTLLRVSSESTTAVFAQLGNGRASHDKPRIKLFGSRSSSDHDRADTPASFDEDTKKSSSFDLMDEAALQEFDELMRSSATMKVSLTPDRLKSMEVYKQEKKRVKGLEPENDPFLTVDTEVKRAVSARRAQARLVDSITEDDEPSPVKAQPPSPEQGVLIPRTRQTSLHIGNAPAPPMPTTRTRSVTISTPQPLSKKRSAGQIRPAMPPVPPAIQVPKRDSPVPRMSPMQNGRPPRSRRVARNRESMDLDDVMGREEDEVLSPPMTPASKREVGKPYVSKTARDLIDFLDEGPPQELEPPNFNASVLSLESSKSRSSGRLHRMMSKLTLGGSTEKLSARNSTSDPRRSPNMYSSPAPQAYLPSSLSRNSRPPMPAVVIGTPPPPPGTFSSSPSAESSPYLGGSEQHEAPENPRQHRTSIIRKAVPVWDVETEGVPQHLSQPVQVVAVPPSEKPRSKPSSPLDDFPPVPTTISVSHNGPLAGAGRARGDTFPGRRGDAVMTARSEPSSSAVSPIASPSRTVPSSPVASLRRYSPRQSSLNSVVAASISSVPSVVPSISQAQHLHQLSASPEPEHEHDHHTQESSSSSTLDNSENSPAAMGPASGLTFDDARDLRRLLSVATTAQECRLLLDMFLVKSGYPVLADTDSPIFVPQSSKLETPDPEEEASKIGAANGDLERSLVMHYLGGFDDDLLEHTADVPHVEPETPEPFSYS